AQDFDSHPFGGTTAVERVSLIRAGGAMWGQEHGALKIQAARGPVSGVAVADVLVESPTFSGIQLQGPEAIESASFARVAIADPGAAGIAIDAARGGATFSDVTVTPPGDGPEDSSGGGFTIT